MINRQRFRRIAPVVALVVLGAVIGTAASGSALAQRAADPTLRIVAAEPTSGLDPLQRLEVRRLIQELSKERTVLLSSHILPEIEATCPRVIILHRGRVAADGTQRELIDAPQIDRLNIGAIPTIKLDWLQPHEGNIVEFLFRPRAFQAAFEAMAV